MTKSNDDQPVSPWMKPVLRAAGIYNVLWGAWVVFFPLASLRVCGYADPPTYPELWQCIGMIVGVYGIGYWIAASNPFRHWPVILVGFLGKILGPLGFYYAWVDGRLPLSAGVVNIFNDLIWWIPFSVILWRAFRFHHVRKSVQDESLSFEEAMRTFQSQTGTTLGELSADHRVLVIFLRHAGCTFCREALSEVQTHRAEIEAIGTRIAFVHMEDEASAEQFFTKYDLGDLPRFSDPNQVLYRAFEIGLGRFQQLIGFQVLWKGFLTALVKGHGFNKVQGNMFRMPGAFVLENGKVLKQYAYKNAADRPDYAEFVCEIPNGEAV